MSKLLTEIAPRRIAIIKPSALGDVVQALPLLPVLRQRFPASSLTWVIQRELQDIVAGHPCVDHLIGIDRRPSWSSAWTTLWELRQGRFDLVFDLQGLARSAIMTFSTGARWRVGLETAREGSAYTTNMVIPDTGRDIPAHARYWRVAEALGMGHVKREAWVNVQPHDLTRASQWLAELPRPIFGVQWGAKWITKRWPIERFAELLTRAGERWQGSVVIVGGSADREACRTLQKRLAERLGAPRVLDLTGQTRLKELAAVLSQLDFMVSNDSGPMHLAAELGTPTLGIFTCTNSRRSGPPGDRHVMVSTNVPCAGSYRKVCPHGGDKHMACHTELTTERVWQGLVRLVEQHTACSLPLAASEPSTVPLRLTG